MNIDVWHVTTLFTIQYYLYISNWNYSSVQVNPVIYELEQPLVLFPVLVGKKVLNQRNELSWDDLITAKRHALKDGNQIAPWAEWQYT